MLVSVVTRRLDAFVVYADEVGHTPLIEDGIETWYSLTFSQKDRPLRHSDSDCRDEECHTSHGCIIGNSIK